MSARPLFAALLGTALAAPAVAQPIVLENAQVFDGRASLGEHTLVIEAGRISAIGPAGEITLPAQARRIDYSGKTIIPGLVNNHAHVGNTDGADHGREFYTRERVLRDLRQFQAYGVTTVVAMGLNAPPFYAIRAEIRSGQAQGADFFGAGPGIGVEGGAPPASRMNLEPDQVSRPADAEAAREAVREMAAAPQVDVVKLWVDDMDGEVPMMSAEVYRAVIEESRAQGLKSAAHIHDLEPARSLVEAGVDIIAHGVRDTAVDDAFAALMREHGSGYIATLQIDEADYIFAANPGWLQDPFVRNALADEFAARVEDAQWRREQLGDDTAADARRAVATNQANLRALHGAGVRIGFGTDSGALPHRVIGVAEHRELELMVEAGLTPLDALRIATAGAAELMDFGDRGILEPGRRADLVVLDADPLHDIRNTRRIHAVWQHGEKVAGPVTEYLRRGDPAP